MVVFNDMIVYDVHLFSWSEISSLVKGSAGRELFSFGFGSMDNRLYLHAGANQTGTSSSAVLGLKDLLVLPCLDVNADTFPE